MVPFSSVNDHTVPVHMAQKARRNRVTPRNKKTALHNGHKSAHRETVSCDVIYENQNTMYCSIIIKKSGGKFNLLHEIKSKKNTA